MQHDDASSNGLPQRGTDWKTRTRNGTGCISVFGALDRCKDLGRVVHQQRRPDKQPMDEVAPQRHILFDLGQSHHAPRRVVALAKIEEDMPLWRNFVHWLLVWPTLLMYNTTQVFASIEGSEN